MGNDNRVPVMNNFWNKTEKEPNTVLFQDQLGWQPYHKVESGGYNDTFDIWQHLMNNRHIRGVGWDLCFYYPSTGIFYYIDQIAKVLYELPYCEGCGETSIFEGVEIRPQLVPEDKELMDFNSVSDIWEKFTIEGKNMKYILEHSVLFLST